MKHNITAYKGIHRFELLVIIGILLALALIGSSVEFIAQLLESLF